MLQIGGDVSWSSNLAEAVGRLPHDYVFLFLDDFRYRAPAELSLIIWLLYKKSDGMHLKFNEIFLLSFAIPISGFLIAMAHF